jgi:YHS domain-containing protein
MASTDDIAERLETQDRSRSEKLIRRMSATTVTVRDPICGMEIEPKSAAAIVERDGEKVYFCSLHCRNKFVAENEKQPACCDQADHSPNDRSKKYLPDVRRHRQR